VQTAAEIRDAYNMEYMTRILADIRSDVDRLINTHDTQLEVYVCKTVSTFIDKFFEKPGCIVSEVS
jgi:hypothetical protein